MSKTSYHKSRSSGNQKKLDSRRNHIIGRDKKKSNKRTRDTKRVRKR